ncbi:MAG: peptidoglycan DD-metalloendopeptidase family protein [Candidatus Limnocylindrales bacterium]
MLGFPLGPRSSPPDVALRPHRRPRPLFVVLLCLPVLIGMLGTPVATADDLSDAIAKQKALQTRIATQKKQVAALGQQQVGLRARITTTAKKLDVVNANLAGVQEEVDTLVASIALTRASYTDLVNQMKSIDGQMRALQNEEIRRQKDLVARKKLLADRIRAAYATGNTSILETILTSRSFTDVLSEVGYYLDVGVQDQVLAADIVQNVREVGALHQAVLAVRAETEDLRGLVTAQKKELDGDLSDLKAAQAKLKAIRNEIAASLANQKRDYDRLASNKTALAAAIKRATAAKAALAKRIDKLRDEQRNAGRIPSVYNGTLNWPMQGRISQEFGCTGVVYEPAIGNCSHFHQGIDMVAPYGTPIRASGPGTVLYIGWNYADGYDPAWIVIVAHSAGLETWYAHMQPNYPVRAGQFVAAGTIVGYEGNTGHSTGAHLHWAVRFNGAFVNPRLFV